MRLEPFYVTACLQTDGQGGYSIPPPKIRCGGIITSLRGYNQEQILFT